jgi:hypothetical protein
MFLIFAGDSYYPRGGWDDLLDYADNFTDALDVAARLIAHYDWCHVADLESKMQVEVVKFDHDNFTDHEPCWRSPMDWKERYVRWIPQSDDRCN